MFFKKIKQSETERIAKVTPEEYLFHYISWEMSAVSNDHLSPQTVCYHSFSAMAPPMLEMEAENNVPGAVEELGERYLFGINGFHRDEEQAKKLLEKAAALGHPDADGVLASIYMNDKAEPQNMNQYFVLLKKSAERGSWMSMYNLSCAYYKGKEQYGGYGVNMNKEFALEWSMKASVMSRELLKLMFTHPCTNSFQEYMQKMYQVFVQATCVSAEQLIDGDGVEKNLHKAKELLKEAVDFHREVMNGNNMELEKLLKECRVKLGEA